MIYGKDYEELYMTDELTKSIDEQTDGLLLEDFQEWLTESMAGADQYDYRNAILQHLINTIHTTGHGDKDAFAALGETLYQWAEEQAKIAAMQDIVQI
jgi:hypothetical protein